jgi:4-amino-4-deoxy-L-arabinose transferase-like glycosyltransferase
MLSNLNMRPRHYLWFFLAAITLLRLLAALKLPLGVDEAHYVLYGRWIDWSYFDHPSLIGWVQFFMIQLPLPELLQARLAPLMLSVLTSFLIWNYLQKLRFSEAQCLTAVTALNLTPMFNALSVAFLPDTLLMPLTVLVVSKTEDVIQNSDLRNWALLGFYLGLSGLSKYTAVLFIIALALVFFQQRKWAELLRWPLWVGVLIALICISPVLYWNLQNHFASFQYQANHVLSFNVDLFKNVFTTALSQILVWGLGPGLMGFYFYHQLLKQKNKSPHESILFVFLTVFLLFFTYASLSKVLLPHWLLVYFLLAVPFAFCVDKLRENKARFFSIAISALLSLLILSEAAFRILPGRWTATLYRDLTGWSELMSAANARATELGAESLAVMNWTLGSRALYYSRSERKVFVVDSRQDQFDLWTGFPQKGANLLIIVEAEQQAEHLRSLQCEKLSPVGEKSFKLDQTDINHFLFFHCDHFIGYNETSN